MITDEKRAFKRVRRKFRVRHKPHNEAGAGGTSISENISLGGVYFISLEKFSIGQLLECSIAIPDSLQEGNWIARVVRCENLSGNITETFGVAVEFVRSSGDSEKILKKALSK